jgi:hypothetical protein
MNPMTVYIAGRVTGLPREQAERNFSLAGAMLHANGMNPVNPMDLVPEGTEKKEAMKVLIPKLLDCDAIYMQNNYVMSEGATLEYHTAKYVGIHVFFAEDFE